MERPPLKPQHISWLWTAELRIWSQVSLLVVQAASLSDDACAAVAKTGVKVVATAATPVKVAVTRILLPDAFLLAIRFNEHSFPIVSLPR
jgi:hypothetical protein